MTKSKLIDTIAKKIGLPRNKTEQLTDCVFDMLEKSLVNGQRIEIRGFGSFEVRNYDPYKGRNPRTGSVVHVKAKKLPFFKVGKELKERINTAFLSKSSKSKSARTSH